MALHSVPPGYLLNAPGMQETKAWRGLRKHSDTIIRREVSVKPDEPHVAIGQCTMPDPMCWASVLQECQLGHALRPVILCLRYCASWCRN